MNERNESHDTSIDLSSRELKFLIYQKLIKRKENNLMSNSEMRSELEKDLQIPKHSLRARKGEVEGFMRQFQNPKVEEEGGEGGEQKSRALNRSIYKAGKWSKKETEVLIQGVREYAQANNYNLVDLFPESRSENSKKKRKEVTELLAYLGGLIPERSKEVIYLDQ